MTIKATPTPGKSLIAANDHTLVMIDFQSQMAFPLRSMDVATLRSNVAMIAKGARGFGKRNFKALFESIEREQARRGNL